MQCGASSLRRCRLSIARIGGNFSKVIHSHLSFAQIILKCIYYHIYRRKYIANVSLALFSTIYFWILIWVRHLCFKFFRQAFFCFSTNPVRNFRAHYIICEQLFFESVVRGYIVHKTHVTFILSLLNILFLNFQMCGAFVATYILFSCANKLFKIILSICEANGGERKKNKKSSILNNII